MNRFLLLEKFEKLNLDIDKSNSDSEYYNINKEDLVNIILKYSKNLKIKKYCELMLNNLKNVIIGDNYIPIFLDKQLPFFSFYQLVTSIFSWIDSIEGDTFWRNIYDNTEFDSYNILELIYRINLNLYPDE